MTERRWIADRWDTASATLLGTKAQHLARVLRAAPGQHAQVVAGDEVWSAVIQQVGDDAVVFTLEHRVDAAAALPVAILLAVFKFDRLEWAIEKLTELGVDRIAPVITRRTEKHLAQAAEKRQERWQRIALEATQQSRRAEVPSFTPVRTLQAALADEQTATRIVLSEVETRQTLASALTAVEGPVLLAVGPEGGWTPEEQSLFAAKGWTAATLGPRILRAETASIAALAVAASLL